jgi:hypothetical protein
MFLPKQSSALPSLEGCTRYKEEEEEEEEEGKVGV